MIEHGIFYVPKPEGLPPSYIPGVEAGPKKNRHPKNDNDKDKARRWNETHQSRPVDHPGHRFMKIKRSQRRAK